MESGPLSEEEFKEFGDKVVLFCHITSRVKDDPYQELLSEKGGGGFPYLAYMDADGNVIAKPRGRRSIASFEDGLSDDVPAYYELKKKAAEGDKEVKAEFFMKRFELAQFTVADLKKAVKGNDFLSEDQVETIDLALRGMEVNEIIKTHKVNYRDPKTFGPAAKALLKMKKEGRFPKGGAARTPYFIMMGWAYIEKDPKLFEECYNAFKEAPGRRLRPQFLEEQDRRLEELKAAAKEEGEKKGEKPTSRPSKNK